MWIPWIPHGFHVECGGMVKYWLLGAFGGRDVASLGAGGIDELTPDWPKSGQSPGGLTAAVAAARNGGGGG